MVMRAPIVFGLVGLLALLAQADRSQERVRVALYGESLCPYTIRFIKKTLGPLADGALAPYFEFTYTAWGNAKTAQGGVKCQHGPAECRLNRVINCAQALHPEQGHWLPFVRCLESSRPFEMEKQVGRCAQDTGIAADALQACATGLQGDELERQAAEATAALRPPHTYVPWVLVNGVPLGQDDRSLYKFICVALRGDQPDKCFAPPDDSLRLSLGSQADGAEKELPAAA